MSRSTYCPNCGMSNSSDSIFCEQCGYQMLVGSREKTISSRIGIPEETSRFDFSRESRSNGRHFRRYRYRGSHRGAKIAFLAIFFSILIIWGALYIFPRLDQSYYSIGSTYQDYYSFDNPAMTEAEFIINNAVGRVDVNFSDNSSEVLVSILTRIRGKSGVSIDEAAQFETYSYGNRTIFLFNSVDRTLPNSKWYDYEYDIVIMLNTQIVGLFDIHVGSGEIDFRSNENARVKELSLETTSGDIYSSIHYTTFLNTKTPNMMISVSGSIYAHFVDLSAENTTSWDIKTISGSIYVETIYEDEPPSPKQFYFDLETISGEIRYEFLPYEYYNTSKQISLGYTMDASTLTGSIALIGFGNESYTIEFPYTTLNYGSALLNFDLTFITVSGSITINKGTN